MRSLFRATLSLVRSNPILWLPVAIVEVVNFNLRWLERIVHRELATQLAIHLSQAHSVLSENTYIAAPTPDLIRKVTALTAPITFGSQLLCDFLLAAAMVATAVILESLSQTGRASLRASIAPTAGSSYRIFIFSLKLFGLNLVSGAIVGLLAPLVASLRLPQTLEGSFPLSLRSSLALETSGLIGNLVTYLWILPVTLAVVCVIAPLQVRLIQPPDSVPAPDQAKRARLAGILAAVSISTLTFLVSTLEAFLFQMRPTSSLLTYAAGFAAILITAVPNIPLYIAFYLIATPADPHVATAGPEDSLPEPPQSPPESISA